MGDPTDSLQPWMRGPFELIRHANGHLLQAGDTDRRLALIGFDNAIEVSIDVFIQLHPKLRHGLAIPREASERARQNYHTKIEFLDSYATEGAPGIEIPIESIVWYHQLRNDLYHSGNGMVPEFHDEMEFMRVFIDFEKALRGFLEAHHRNDIGSLRSVPDMWRFYAQRYGSHAKLDHLLMRAVETRNAIAHGGRLSPSEDGLITIAVELMELIASLEDRT
jgi:hypothetical protein